MTKIYYDDSSLSGYISEGLKKAVSALERAKAIANALSVPWDFYYNSKNYLYSLDDKIKSDIDRVSGVHKRITNLSKAYNLIGDELNQNVSGIENYSISLRQSAIK